MTVETDLSSGSGSSKVELEEKSDLNSSLCEDQERVDDVDGESEVKEEDEGEGENGAYVMVGDGGRDAVEDSVVHENVEQEANLEVEIVESDDTLKDEEELREEIAGNVEAAGEGILSFEGEAEHVDDDGKSASVDDDENVDIVDYEENVEKIDNVDDDVEKIENVDDVGKIEIVGDDEKNNDDDGDEKIENADDVEKIENTDYDVAKIENVDGVEKIENVVGDDKIEEEMKLETPVEVEYVPSELDQVNDLNSIKKVDEGEFKSGDSDLVAKIKGNQENEKSESFEEEVEKQVCQVMFPQNFEFEELDDDVIANKFTPPPPIKEDDVKLERDIYVEDTDSICKIGDSNGTPLEISEVKEDVDSSYVFVDGTEAVFNEPLEVKPAIGDMTNLGSVRQTEESQIYPHLLCFGTIACRISNASSAGVSPSCSGDKGSPSCSGDKGSPSCSVVDNAKPDIGMENFFPDQSEYLPTSSSSDPESNEAVNPVGDVYLESEVGTGSNRSNGESTPSSSGDTLDEKKGDEKMEKRPIFRYLIRVPRYFDDKIEEQIVHAQQQVEEMTQRRDAIREEVQAKKATYRDKIEAAKLEENAAHNARHVKRQEMESVQSMLNRIKSVFMVEEMGDQIRSMQHRIEHETISLKEEKQLIRDMKQLKLRHQQLCSDLDKLDGTQPAVEQKEPLEERLKLLKKDLDSVRNEVLRTEEITNAAWKVYHDENEKLRKRQEQFRSANVLRQEAYACVQKLKKQLYEKNEYFRMYKEDARKAEEYKYSGDKEALNSHCVNQVEKFMELWNNDDDFRNEYLRLNRRSTLRRLHTSEVLSLGHDETFIPWKVREEVRYSVPSVSTSGQGKPVSPLEHNKKEEKLTVRQNENHQTILKNETIPIVLENSAATVSREVEAEQKTEEASKQTEEEKELARREEESAAAKIREQRLLEERAKAKEAEERKRRTAEKAQARAELKAQKEAEQKEKDIAKRERKKARKNATKGTNENEQLAPSSETALPERTSQEPEVAEKLPKIVSKRNQRPSILAKKIKANILSPPLPLRNKNKKRMQPWMWILLTALIIAGAVIFLPTIMRYTTHFKK